jgi:hypothetical protein
MKRTDESGAKCSTSSQVSSKYTTKSLVSHDLLLRSARPGSLAAALTSVMTSAKTQSALSPPGQGADPVPHGHGWQHTLLEMHGHAGHASAETARAEAALLAGERYDLGIAAAPAHEVQTALFDDAALEELLEFGHDKLRQAARLLHALAADRSALFARVWLRSRAAERIRTRASV